jgi:hypothetical protein
MPIQARAVILNELRYAERLCQRTARLYRHVQTAGTALTVLGGSAAMSALVKSAPDWLAVIGGIVFTVAGALMIAVRPADKAAAAEVDGKRYTTLCGKAHGLDDAALQVALDDLRSGDVPEFENLRDVVYNDIVREIGRPEQAVALSPLQRLVSLLA